MKGSFGGRLSLRFPFGQYVLPILKTSVKTSSINRQWEINLQKFINKN